MPVPQRHVPPYGGMKVDIGRFPPGMQFLGFLGRDIEGSEQAHPGYLRNSMASRNISDESLRLACGLIALTVLNQPVSSRRKAS